jgi:hypothetical protein
MNHLIYASKKYCKRIAGPSAKFLLALASTVIIGFWSRLDP